MDERPWVFGEYQNEYFAHEFQTKTIYLCISVIFPFRFHQINYVSMEFVRPRWADKIDKCVCRSNFLWVFVRRPFCRSTWLVRTCNIRIQRVIHTISPYDEPLFIPTMLLFLFVFYVIYAFVSIHTIFIWTYEYHRSFMIHARKVESSGHGTNARRHRV